MTTGKIMMVNSASWWNLSDVFSITPQEHFVYEVKAVSNDFSTELA